MTMQFLERYKQVSSAAKIIYLRPTITYKYEEIITGVRVGGKTMMAVDESTFQAFGRFNPNMYKAKECYLKYFIDNKNMIISALNSVCSQFDIDYLENNLFNEIFSSLASKTDKTRLDSYNRIRKPINLYLQHIAFMANEIDNRERLCQSLYMPLDRVIFGLEPVFSVEERKRFGISASLGFGQIKSKSLYDEIQKYLCLKAKEISMNIQRPFEPIYFDLFWNNRYTKDLRNLFYSNLKDMAQANEDIKIEQKQIALFNSNNFDRENMLVDVSTTENKDNMDVRKKQIIRKMQIKLKFFDKYEKAALPLRELFIKLIIMADEKFIANKATNTPDYRLVERNGNTNFCLITFSPNSLNLHIHRNRFSLDSDILHFSPIPEGRHTGPDWIEVKVRNNVELGEAFRLIYTIYQKS